MVMKDTIGYEVDLIKMANEAVSIIDTSGK